MKKEIVEKLEEEPLTISNDFAGLVRLVYNSEENAIKKAALGSLEEKAIKNDIKAAGGISWKLLMKILDNHQKVHDLTSMIDSSLSEDKIILMASTKVDEMECLYEGKEYYIIVPA